MTREVFLFLLHWRERLARSMARALAPLPEKKVFKPKNNLPILDSYKGGAPATFWENFPSNFVQPAPPSINAEVLKALALDFPSSKV